MEREKAIKILEHTKNEMVATFADDPHAYWAEQIEALSMAIEAIKESATAEDTIKYLETKLNYNKGIADGLMFAIIAEKENGTAEIMAERKEE